MIFCTNCGCQLDDDCSFCTECGTPVSSGQGTAPSADESASSFAPTEGIDSQDALRAAPVPSAAGSVAAQKTPQEDGKNPSTKLIIGIIAAVVVVALIVVLVIAVSAGSSEEAVEEPQEEATTTMVSMPDLDGMTEESAIAVLSALGLECDIEYIDDIEQLVLEQTPEPGAQVPLEEQVTITLGNGKSSTTSQMGKARTVTLTVANPRNGAVTSADIRLDANDDVIPDLLTRQYTADEIRAMGLSDAELYIARNSIVAKSGYIFHYDPNTQFFIDNCAWYRPTTSEYQLQGIGAVNAGVIREVEASHGSWYLEIK